MILRKNKLESPIKFLFALVLILNSCNVFSQCQIAGIIKTKDNEVVQFANVFIMSENSQEIISFCSSDEKGNYVLIINQAGKFNLNLTALSFQKKVVPIDIKSGDKKMSIDAILISEPLQLKEVVVSQNVPIMFKNDTIVFDASSFLQGNEQVVEDLLRKIPGISVSKDGVITVGNKEVEKVMVEGDDFFEKGYKMLTKNMQVSPVSKVELLNHYSNNKLLKGIEKSDKVALNLKLKEDAKQHWFGSLSLGYGLDVDAKDRYDSKSNLMNFSKKSKFYFFANANNIGASYDGYIENLIHPVNLGDEANMGNEQSAYTFLSLSGYTPNLDSKRVTLNRSKILSLNNIYNLSPKLKIKAIGLVNTEKNQFHRNSYQKFNLEDIAFTNIEDFKLRTNQFTGFGKLDFSYDISTTKILEVTGKFKSTDDNNNGNNVFNNDLIDEGLKSNNMLIDNKITFSNKFSSNKVFTVTARYINANAPQNYTSNKFIYSELFPINADNVEQSSKNRMEFWGFEGYIIDRKKNGNLFEIQFGNQYRKDSLWTQFKLKKGNDIVGIPTSYQNRFLLLTNDLYVKAKYLFKLKNVGLQTGLDIHWITNNLIETNNSQAESPFIFNPSFNIYWNINKKNNISTFYSYNTKNSEIQDVFSQYIQTDLYSFSKGTGSFDQLNESSATVNYSYGNWGDKFFANTSVLYNRNYNYVSTNTIVTQNYLESENVIVNGRNYFSFSLNINRYFKVISSNLKLSIDVSKSEYKRRVNNSDLKTVKRDNFNCGVELRSGFRGFINYHFGSNWSFSQTKTIEVNLYAENKMFLDLYFNISDKFNVITKNEMYAFQNKNNGNNVFFFSDVEARYVMIENRLSLSLLGQNLFNTKTFLNYSINDISISKTECRLQPRIVILKAEYKF